MKLATTPGEILHEGSASARKTHQAASASFNRPVPVSAAEGDPRQRTIQRSIRDDQICVLTFDRPGSSANIFDLRTLKEAAEELDFVAGASQLKGLIIISAKRSIFIAGADLHTMSAASSAEQVRGLIELGQSVMNRLAALPIPTVAAVHGAALGGGYELCLACDYRVASSDRATKIGLPETQLGLLPAWGGSTRLPRLIGLPGALDVILGARTLAAKPALKRGMIDEVVAPEYLMTMATRLISRGKRHQPRHWALNNPVVASIVRARLHSRLLKKTRGHYPAVLKAMEVVTRGISKSIPESLEFERDGILDLVQTDATRNLIRVFFLQERAKKRSVEVASPSKPIARAGVIGAGVMGAGIAQWLSARRVPVILRDINTEQVAKGMSAIAKLYGDGLKRHVFTPLEVREGLDRVSPAPSEVPLNHVDLVIEAAVENLDLKKKIFERLDALSGEDTILATNTSALPVSELAGTTRRPERVLGLHFFNPVHRMQLVEIIAARQTSPEVLQRALRFVQQIGKLPVIVKDSPGFLVNRILMPYLVEAGSLFENGASATDLDEAMLDFGMPMGPMRLLDEVGIDVSLHVAQTLAAHYPDRMAIPQVLSKLAKAGLLGRKAGRGFYVHPKGKEAYVNTEVSVFRNSPTGGVPLARADLQQRMVFLMINEAARCLEEQIVDHAADIDFAMIMGTGFAPFRGGPLRYADTLGPAKLVSQMDALVTSGNRQFAPCALLRSMASTEKNFYADK